PWNQRQPVQMGLPFKRMSGTSYAACSRKKLAPSTPIGKSSTLRRSKNPCRGALQETFQRFISTSSEVLNQKKLTFPNPTCYLIGALTFGLIGADTYSGP